MLESIARDTANIYRVTAEELLAVYDDVVAQAIRIKESGSSRTLERIQENCWEGTIGEVGWTKAMASVINHLSSIRNPLPFDKTDALSYAYDTVSTFQNINVTDVMEQTDDYLCEVKRVSFDEDIPVFRFNYLPGWGQTGLDLTTFINKGSKIADFLVLIGVREMKDDCAYDIRPRYIIRADRFTHYLEKCEVGESRLTHKVNLDKMIEHGTAIKIQ